MNQKYLNALKEESLPIAPVSIGERGSMLGDAWDNQVSIYELTEYDDYRDLRDYEEPTLEKFDELAVSSTAIRDGVAVSGLHLLSASRCTQL